ncbi:trafficking protein particle complex subunit 10 [Pisolithus sp. B1]|nr:trafficking protein particle complex subunit 10 [Pisolithus sp. B1]
MASQRVLVTYVAAQSFQSSDSWSHFLAALRSLLPLRNLHWKPASRPNLRTVQELDVSLVPLDSLRDEHTSQVPVTLLEKPLLNLYVLSCEDVETYKTIVKKQIKDWHTSVNQRKNQEWLIIHVARPDSKNVDRKFFSMKGSVLDKIKADFNTDKRDRCVQLAWSMGEQSPAVWADLIGKSRMDSLLHLTQLYKQGEEEVKRSEGQRHMPGWNFCTYFILKESLATSFEGVNLFEDALQQYNELEATFMNVLGEKNMSWFGNLINPTPKDDSLPLLSPSKKSYRELILANTISVFDLRVYLLARQSMLLNKLQQPIEICRKAMLFLSTFGKRLREIEKALPEHFVESWIFSSALSVVDQCDSWASSWPELEGIALARYNANKGELLELAKSQLDILGVKVGHLPPKPPFSMAIQTVTTTPGSPLPERNSSQQISKYEVLLAVGDSEAFYDLYCTISNQTIDMYVKAGRRKFALKLHGCLAALDKHRGRLSNALAIFSSLPAHYAPHMWTSLESFMLSRAIDTHTLLQKPRDREWIHLLLAFLRTYVNETSTEPLISHNIDHYVTKLATALREVSEKLDSDLAHPDHPVMALEISKDVRCSQDEDLVYLTVLIHNHLPCDVDVDEVGVVLVGEDTARLKFTGKFTKLVPGKNCVTLTCPTSSHGTYVHESTEIQIAHLHLQWNHKGGGGTGMALTSRKRAVLVHLPRNPESLDVQLCLPPNSLHPLSGRVAALGTSPRLHLIISSGRNDLAAASVKLSAPAGITFDFVNSRLHSKGAGEIDVLEDGISIFNVPPKSNTIILVPHSDVTRFRAIKIDVSITYKTVRDPALERTLRTSKVATVALPVAVNVEDFFRGERQVHPMLDGSIVLRNTLVNRLFSRFTISTTTQQHVRISSARLLAPLGAQGVKILGCRPSHSVMTAVPDRPVSYIFCIESDRGPVLDPLELVISYRLLREEVEALVNKTVEDVLHQLSQESEVGTKIVQGIIEYLECDASWVALYNITGELIIPTTLDVGGEAKEVFSSVQKILSQPNPPSPSLGPWREMTIPVDVPKMNIVADAWIAVRPFPQTEDSPHSECPPIYAGQALSATVCITTSLHWNDPDNKGQRYRMRYDVEERTKDWLICGRKRGDFVVQDKITFNVSLTLVPLHHGYISLPKADVRPLPLDGEENVPRVLPSSDTHQSHGAETVLVLPRGGRSTFIVNMGTKRV